MSYFWSNDSDWRLTPRVLQSPIVGASGPQKNAKKNGSVGLEALECH